MGTIRPLTIPALNFNPMSVWILNATSKMVAPLGKMIMSPFGVKQTHHRHIN